MAEIGCALQSIAFLAAVVLSDNKIFYQIDSIVFIMQGLQKYNRQIQFRYRAVVYR